MKSKSKKTKTLFCSYQGLRGVDFSSKRRDCFCRLENMYVDYSTGGDCIESIPGFRRLYSFGDKVSSVFVWDGWVFVHAGSGLYRFAEGERNNLSALRPIAKMPYIKSPIVSLGSNVCALGEDTLVVIEADGAVKEYTVPEEIRGCTIAACYGKEMFFSGNKSYPCRIYYFGFDKDGAPIFEQIRYVDAMAGVNSLLVFGDELLIFDDLGVSCCAQGLDGYRVRGVLSAGRCYGSVCFLGKAMFICDNGIFDLDGTECYSNEILPALSEVDLELAQLSAWCGYLALCCKGEIFLADPKSRSRGNGRGFDWYYLCRIGTYRNDRRVYRYASFAEETFCAHPSADSVAEGVVMSFKDEGGNTIYYTEQDGKRYSVYPTEEFWGGDFCPADSFASVGELLYFANEWGDLCLFNNDMRGVVPSALKEEASLTPGERSWKKGVSIHSDLYSFDSHSPGYLMVTPNDDLGFPCQKKHTSSNSLCVKLKDFGKSRLTVSVKADGRRMDENVVQYGSLDFSALDFEAIIDCKTSEAFTLNHAPRGWICQQISITGNDFCSPIGVYSMSYRCKAEDK